jgi:hypothetical protein
MNIKQLDQILDAMKNIGFKVRTQKKEADGHRRSVEENPSTVAGNG